MSKPVREPIVRKSAKCVVCKKARPYVAIAHGDPFCSSKCCQQWYAEHKKKPGKA